MEARRALLLFRLALYPAALALLVWLLAGRGEAAEAGRYDGSTSQARPIALTVDGEEVTVEARVEAVCIGSRPGYRYYSSWAPGRLDGGRVAIRRRSGKELGEGWTSERSYEVRADRGEDGFEGTISVTETWDGGDAGWSRCSGDVAFTAQR